MNTKDKHAYTESLRRCVEIATRNGYTAQQVATDIQLLITPPHNEVNVFAKLEF